MMPKRVDHEARRSDLIAAAWRTIRRVGIAKTTTREIAREAGYTHGLLAYYFPDKHAILDAALERVYQKVVGRAMERVSNRRGLDALREVALASLPIDSSEHLEFEVMINSWSAAMMEGEHRERIRDLFQQHRHAIHHLVETAIEAGEIAADIGADEVTRNLLAFIDGLAFHAVLFPDEYGTREIVHIVDTHIRLYRAGPRASTSG